MGDAYKIHEIINSINFNFGRVGSMFLYSVIGKMKSMKFKDNLIH